MKTNKLTVFRWLFRQSLKLLTRTTFSGLSRFPASGALIVIANHASTIDPVLMIAASRRDDSYFVGPNDFKLLFPGNLLVESPFVIQVRRSLQIEITALKRMVEVLKQGHCLTLFPEGGTWEKPLTDAKSGAAYLSMLTGAPILPIGLGGAYQCWSGVMRLRRPRLSVRVGELMPPIAMPSKRSDRDAVQTAATHRMMRQIYDLLPAADQQRYDDLAQRRYGLRVIAGEAQIDVQGGEILGELMQKPNLISPFVHNARLPIRPFTTAGPSTGAAVAAAARELLAALRGPFAGYMEYRLGEEKSQQLASALQQLTAFNRYQQVTLQPFSWRTDQPIQSSPNHSTA